MLYQQIGDRKRAWDWMGYYLSRAVDKDPEAQAIYARLNTPGR
jgi:hypothetical protein